MHLLIFGLGYTAGRLAERLRRDGWRVTASTRSATPGTYPLACPEIAAAVGCATHILSSVPPVGGRDAVLDAYAGALAAAPARWVGYLSSTGVYSDTGGAWVDETSPLGGRRADRIAADRAWHALRPDIRVFRLPGIYGPGRSALDAVAAGRAHRVDTAQRFSRIHVDDIGRAIVGSFERGAGGIYNLADAEPAPGRAVVEYACDLLGRPYPPLIAPDSERLSPMARGFYGESRLVGAGKAARDLGFRAGYADFRAGLRACLAGHGGRRGR